MTEENDTFESVEADIYDGPGEYAIIVELSQNVDVKSRNDAVAAARKMQADLNKSSAMKSYDVGRSGIRLLSRKDY